MKEEREPTPQRIPFPLPLTTCTQRLLELMGKQIPASREGPATASSVSRDRTWGTGCMWLPALTSGHCGYTLGSGCAVGPYLRESCVPCDRRQGKITFSNEVWMHSIPADFRGKRGPLEKNQPQNKARGLTFSCASARARTFPVAPVAPAPPLTGPSRCALIF